LIKASLYKTVLLLVINIKKYQPVGWYFYVAKLSN
jgi:hypothetical protein